MLSGNGPLSSINGAARRDGDETVLAFTEHITGWPPQKEQVMTALQERRCWWRFMALVGTCLAVLLIVVMIEWRKSDSAARDPATGKVRPHTFQYFVLCFLGGAFAGLSHVVVTPMDVVKCRMQVGEYASMQDGFRRIFCDAKGSCVRALPLLFRGWVPTLNAYCIQGALKFSLYELFKYILVGAWLSPEASGLQQLATYLVASSVAEVFADIGLAPFEAVKIKVQTTNVFPTDMRSVLPRIWAAEGLNGFFKGLVPLWCRQVPYTMMKFASFENIVRALNGVFLSGTAKPSAVAELLITMVAGVLAGILCALISHPADTLVSKLNQRGAGKRSSSSVEGTAMTAVAAGMADDAAVSADPDAERLTQLVSGAELTLSQSVTDLIRELGWAGLWRGLLPRMAMVGSLTSLQWLMYDAFKVAAGLPTTGAASGGGGAKPSK